MTQTTKRSRWGPPLLIAGTAVLLVLAIPEWRGAIPWGWFHKAMPIWLMLTLAVMSAGIRLLWIEDYADADGLGPAGPRFRHLVLYSRDNCPLCEEVQALLEQYARYLPPLVVIDISRDEELTRQHGTWIPVVEIDGRIRFRGRVSEPMLRRMIRMARPTG